MRQCSVVFAGSCVLDWSATSENVRVLIRFEFVWRIRGYVHITMNTLSNSFATFLVMDRTAGRVGSGYGFRGSGRVLTRVQLCYYIMSWITLFFGRYPLSEFRPLWSLQAWPDWMASVLMAHSIPLARGTLWHDSFVVSNVEPDR